MSHGYKTDRKPQRGGSSGRQELLTAWWMAGVAAAYAQPLPPVGAANQGSGSRRDDVKIMEVVLTNAVKNGADTLARQMQIQEPGSIIVTGTARARGFVLDGYGVFFIVDVPMMKQSVVWSSQVLLLQQRREFLRQYIANTADSPSRRYAEQMLRTLEPPMNAGNSAGLSQVAQPGGRESAAGAVAQPQPAQPGMVAGRRSTTHWPRLPRSAIPTSSTPRR